jgi:hypothetical protein
MRNLVDDARLTKDAKANDYTIRLMPLLVLGSLQICPTPRAISVVRRGDRQD